MRLLDIARSSTISMKNIRKISKEFDESVTGMTKNLAQLFLIQAIEKMIAYGDLYVYEGRFPVEEPEVVNMEPKDLNFARCLARIRYDQLLCNRYEKYDEMSLIPKAQFYHLAGLFYDLADNHVIKSRTDEDFQDISYLFVPLHKIFNILESYLIKDMEQVEYEEWFRFFYEYKKISEFL